jgi:uncharacterized protein (TIGR03437 family)
MPGLATELEFHGGGIGVAGWGTDGIAINSGAHLVFLHLSSLQPVPPVAPSVTADPTGAIRIGLPTGGLLYDATRNQLLASVAGANGGSLGNTIVQIDPSTGAIAGSILAGSDPGPISLTDDGTRVFAALAGAPMIVPVNLTQRVVEQPFYVPDPLPVQIAQAESYNHWFAEDLVTIQGTTESVAVVRATAAEGPRSIVVYDNGIPRPGVLSEDYLADRIYRGDSSDSLFSLDLQTSGAGIYRLIVSSKGVAIDKALISIASAFNGSFAYDLGNFFSSAGTISTGPLPTQVGAFAGSGVPIPFSDRNAVAYVGIDNYSHINLWLFETVTYRPLAALQLSTKDQHVLSAVRTGPATFAFRTDNELILMSLSDLQAWPDLVPALQAVAPGIAKISLMANDIAAAPDGSNLLVATPSTAGKLGNCVLTVDPASATVLASGYVGSEPVKLSVVPGGNQVYASVAGEIGIARFNVATSTRDLAFSADPRNQGSQYYIFDIAAAPDGSVAASFYDGSVASFDGGKLRPNVDFDNDSLQVWTAGELGFQLTFGATNMLYGYAGTLKRWRVSPNGVQPLSIADNLTGEMFEEIELRWAGGLLYSALGDVIDPERSRRVGRFLDGGQQVSAASVWPDAAAGRVYFITGSKILVFDMYNFAEIGSLTLPVSAQATTLVKAGANLAFLTTTGDVWVVDIASIPANSNPVVPPLEQLPSTPGVAVIDLQANDLAYDAAADRLYATTPNSEGALANGVLAIAPGSAVVTATYFGSINPRLIQLSDDGKTAFISNGQVNNGAEMIDEALSSVNLTTGMISQQYDSNNSYVIDGVVPLSGEPGSVAVLNGGMVRVYDGTIQRSNSDSAIGFCTSLQPGADANRLYCYNGTSDFKFSRLAVDPKGVTLLSSSGADLIGGYKASILYSGGRVYASNGRIIDPEAMTLIGTVSASGNVAVDSGLVYFLSAGTSISTPPTVTVTAFDQNTLQQVETRTINVASTTSLSRLVPCGNGRLAFAAGQQIYIAYPASSEPAAPSFDATGVVSSASFEAGASGGELVTIFGQNLVLGVSGTIRAQQFPLPADLGGTSVTIGAVPAPLLAIVSDNGAGQQQVNLQVPFELAGHGSVPVIVNAGGFGSQPVDIDVGVAHPGIFMAGNAQPVITHADYSLVTESSPAAPGEAIILFCTGLGPVAPQAGDGAAAVGVAQTIVTPQVLIGGYTANVLFSGLAPGFAGLYQVNAEVPLAVSAGSASVSVSVNGISSQTLRLAIQ